MQLDLQRASRRTTALLAALIHPRKVYNYNGGAHSCMAVLDHFFELTQSAKQYPVIIISIPDAKL